MLSSDRERQQARERALKERQRAQREAVREEPAPFFPPIKVRPVDNDATSRKIVDTLGDYHAVTSSINKGEAGLIGVDKMPATPAPASWQEEDIDTALPRVVPTPEKVVSHFATPQKRAPVSSRHPSLSGPKNGFAPVRPGPTKAPGSGSKPLPPNFGQCNGANEQGWSRQDEMANPDLSEIFRNMSAPNPIGLLAPTPAREDAGHNFGQPPYLRNHSLDQELAVSDSEFEMDMEPRRSLTFNMPQRPISPFRSIRMPTPPRNRPESPDHRRSLGLSSLPRPLSPFKSIRVASPPRVVSPNHRQSLGLVGLPSRPLSPFMSIRVPSPVRLIPPVVAPMAQQRVSPRGPSNTAAEPMEISSEEEESGDSSSESEDDTPKKPSVRSSPKVSAETSPAHTPIWNLGNFIKTTPLAQSIHGDISEHGPPSEPQISEPRSGPLSIASVTLSQTEECQPLTPAPFGLGETLETSTQVETNLSDNEQLDITRVLKEFRMSIPRISPLRDSDSEQEKKPFANLLRAVGDKTLEKRPLVRSSRDSGSDVDSRIPAVRASPHNAPLSATQVPENIEPPNVKDSPMFDIPPKIDQNKSKSICQVFRHQRGKPSPKQQDPVALGKENVPSQTPVIKCSLKLALLRRVPRKTSSVDAVIDEIAFGKPESGRTDPESGRNIIDSGRTFSESGRSRSDSGRVFPDAAPTLSESGPSATEPSLIGQEKVEKSGLSGGEIEAEVNRTKAFVNKRYRDPSTSTVSSDSENDLPVHRKEEKRKRTDEADETSKKTDSPAFPSQSASHVSPSLHLSQPTNHERTEKGVPSPFVDADQPASRLEPGFPQSGATVESGYESLTGIGYEQEEYRHWPEATSVYYSYYEMMKMENEQEPDERDQNENLMEAKRLKHMADRETDKVLQFILYMEAAMFFIQTGVSMDTDGTPNKGTQNMYKETNNLIKHISTKYRNQDMNTTQGMVLARLMVLSMKAQAILQLKLYHLKRAEVRENTRILNEFFSKENHPIPAPESIRGSTNSPSSPTPSPSGSMNSVGSQSSGQAGQSGARIDEQGQLPPMVVPIPPAVHQVLQRQHHNVGLLQACHDLWEQADLMVMKTRSDEFFILLDRELGPLTLHSSLRELVRKVRSAVEKLGNFYKDR